MLTGKVEYVLPVVEAAAPELVVPPYVTELRLPLAVDFQSVALFDEASTVIFTLVGVQFVTSK